MELIQTRFVILLSFAIRNGAVVCFDKDTGEITVRYNGITAIHQFDTPIEEIKKSVGIVRIRESRYVSVIEPKIKGKRGRKLGGKNRPKEDICPKVEE